MSEKILHFTDLDAWRYGHELAVAVYKVTEQFPQKEIFGLTYQVRKSAVSVPSNIAEGFSRKTSKEKQHFYYISKGSLFELQSQLLIARDIGFIKSSEYEVFEQKTETVCKLICGLIKDTKE